jgi:acylaminoacyl-peptidase
VIVANWMQAASILNLVQFKPAIVERQKHGSFRDGVEIQGLIVIPRATNRSKAANKKAPLRRLVTPEDLQRFRVVTDPQISPDGRNIAFIVRQAGARNQYASNVWIVEVARRNRAAKSSMPSDPWQLTQSGKDSLPRWSPDGKQIAFVRDRGEGRNDLFIISSHGGEAHRLTDFPQGSIHCLLWSPDGRWIAASFRPGDPQWTEEARKQRREAGASDPPHIVEDISYRLDGEGFIAGNRCRLLLVDAATGTYRELLAADLLGESTFDFSPDSRQLVVSANRSNTPSMEPWKDELLRIDLATGRATSIRGLPPGPKTSVQWSPDGKMIAYAGRIGEDALYSPENLELYICHPTRGGAKSLTSGLDLCLQAQGVTDTAIDWGRPTIRFSPDSRRIFMRLSVRGESHVAAIPTRTGRIKYLTRGACDIRLGNVSAADGKLALTVGDATTLAEIAVLDSHRGGAAPRTLTNLNGPLLAELQLSTPQEHWIKAADGHAIQIWTMLPPAAPQSRSPRKKLPAVLEIHGGPHAQYCASFFHEFQVLAAAGYAVFYSNPRGSKGYGRDHCVAIQGRWGTDDWTDVQATIRFMKSHPAVDRRRLGIIGGSYGGYMTNWVIGHCHDFAAAVTDRGISNLVSFSGTCDVIEPPEFFFPGNFWDQVEPRWQQSPLKYIGDARTPTLIIHSEGDLRCSIEQAEQLYTALKIVGVPVRFVRYPRNSDHGMSRSGPPDLRVHRLHEILAWWQRQLRGGNAIKQVVAKTV